MILVSDVVDLNLLSELYTYGSTRGQQDYRGDLYQMKRL